MINLIIEKLMPLISIEIKKGRSASIKQSANNTVIEIPGGGVPDGYEEQSVTLCENGTAKAGKILFKED